MSQEWVLLIHQLPPSPTNLRVRTWRKLQRIGAIAIKNSVYILPFNEKTYEDFQWLKQEIESASGEATVLRASAVEGATDVEIVNQFRNVRDEEYSQIVAELEGLAGVIREQKRSGNLSAGRIMAHETELDRLNKELEHIALIDFFEAPGQNEAMTVYDRCHKILRNSHDRKGQEDEANDQIGGPRKISQYQGRRWYTRKILFVDRLVTIWFIKRFIDKKARFQFVTEGESIEGGIGFDLYDGEFTHRGEDCTFETMIKEFAMTSDIGLRHLAEIVHVIDLKDNKFNRSEAVGLSTVIRGLAEWLKDDRKLINQCIPIFDSLYELLGQTEKSADKEPNGGKKAEKKTIRKGGRKERE